jgi:C4-dicarboxylate-specific signal transduction histidine kinase
MMKAVADQVGVVMIRIHTDHKLRMYHDELEMLVEKRTAELKKSEQRLSAAINATGGGFLRPRFHLEKTVFSVTACLKFLKFLKPDITIAVNSED